MNLAVLKQELTNFDITELNIKYLPVIAYNNTKTIQISDITRYTSHLGFIKSLGIEKENIEEIEVLLRKTENIESFTPGETEGKSIISKSNEIKIGVEKVYDFLNLILVDDPDNSIRIRIPDSDDFSDMAMNLNEFKKAISIPIMHPDIQGNVKIINGEPGSVWLLVYLFARKAVKLVSDIAWSSQVINNKRLEGKLFEQHVRSLELDNQQKALYQEAQKKLLDKFVEVEVEGIIDRNEIKADPEYRNTLRMSILTMEELYNRGAQVRPSLNAPDEILKSFPPLEKLSLVESKVKQITEGEN